jgi:hypothetical protein
LTPPPNKITLVDAVRPQFLFKNAPKIFFSGAFLVMVSLGYAKTKPVIAGRTFPPDNPDWTEAHLDIEAVVEIMPEAK